MMQSIALLVALAAALGAACDDPAVCTQDIRPSLAISVVDSQTHTEICDATLAVRDGDFVFEGTRDCSSNPEYPWRVGSERPGTYEIAATHSNYVSQSTVTTVTKNECHVNTVAVTLELAPLP